MILEKYQINLLNQEEEEGEIEEPEEPKEETIWEQVEHLRYRRLIQTSSSNCYEACFRVRYGIGWGQPQYSRH